LDDISEHVPDEVFDDQGITSAVERLGKAGRLFGRKEVKHLHNVIRSTERVLELGQGNLSGKMGLVVLTTERLLFFERSMMGTEPAEVCAGDDPSSVGVEEDDRRTYRGGSLGDKRRDHQHAAWAG